MAASPPIADRRSWIALFVCLAVAVALGYRWHWLAWVFGVVAVLLIGRAFAMVFAAKSSMSDPEEALEKERREEEQEKHGSE